MSAGPDRTRWLAALALTLNALVWGVSWWPLRQLEALGVHPLWSTALIFVLALAVLFALRPGVWRALWAYPSLIALLLASGVTNVGFNWAVTTGDVVRVVLLFYMMPAWSALLAWPLLGERLGLGGALRVALALAGVMVVLMTPQTPWPWPEGRADWLALVGGFSFALTNILLRRLSYTPEAGRMLAMFGGGALLAGGVAIWGGMEGFVSALPSPQASWVGLALMLGVAFLAGNLALQFGASRLSAHSTALIMLLEVVFASASSVLLGASELTAQTVLGGGLILLAALWSAWAGAS
jgi:drug/metabolite transporter (DMT)-like permease